jgi:hypothetical protein
VQTEQNMREKLFTIRMTEEERVRAERVAQRHGLNVAGVIRMLLKREDDAARAADGEDFRDEHGLLLDLLAQWYRSSKRPVTKAELVGFDFGRSIEGLAPTYPRANWSGGPGRVLNQLVRWGFLERHQGPAYVPTAKAVSEGFTGV